jgi:hypothetical protein
MDRQQVRQHLALADEHGALGAKHVARQREIIAELHRDGHDTTTACALLAQFEEMPAMHVADRDRLLRRVQDHKEPGSA